MGAAKKKGKAAPSAASIVEALRKRFGNEAPRLMTDAGGTGVSAICPTGLSVLDRWVIGIGGLPWGRVVEVYGGESSGKTTLANAFMAAAQRDDARASLYEVEHTWEPAWAARMGVNLDELLFDQPSYIDGDKGTLAKIETTLESARGQHQLIVVDSVAGMKTKKEYDEGLTGEAAMAEQARIWSSAMRKMVQMLDETQSTLVLLNQVRSKPGVMYGPKTVTPGGNAIKFYASLRLELYHPSGSRLDGGRAKAIGVRAVKNKLAVPYRDAQFKLDYEKGFVDRWGIMHHAKEVGCISESCKSYKEALKNLGWEDLYGKQVEDIEEALDKGTDDGDGEAA